MAQFLHKKWMQNSFSSNFFISTKFHFSFFSLSLSLSLSFAHLIHGIVWSKKEENCNDDDDDENKDERSSKLYQIKNYSYFCYKPIWLLDRRCWWSRECKGSWTGKSQVELKNINFYLQCRVLSCARKHLFLGANVLYNDFSNDNTNNQL